jgi:hypothetical protein
MNWRLKSDYKIKRGDYSLLYELLRYVFFGLMGFTGNMYRIFKHTFKLDK